MSESSLSANLKGMLNKPADPILTPSNPNIDLGDNSIHNQVETEPQANIDQFRSSPNMVEESNQKSNIRMLPYYNSSNSKKIKDIYKVVDDEVPMAMTIKIYPSISIELEEYCLGVKKMTGKTCFKQDVITNALIEYFTNHPLDEIFG